MTDSDVAQITKTKTRLKEPSLFNVIYLNDNETTMQFVMATLIKHFDYDSASAKEKMIEIHAEDSAVVATLPYEIAEQKGVEITLEARQIGFPLQVKVEPE